jgi:predicted RNA-binding protein with PUA-like domain
MKNYWLLKTEGDCYSIDDLARDKRTAWTGVRNYQARNFIRSMKEGDGVLIYHSSGKVNGVYGIGSVVGAPYPDPTQFDSSDEHFDPKSQSAEPRWLCADIEFVRKLNNPITLETIKHDNELSEMLVCRRGNRLSVMPVERKHYERF